MDHQALQKVLEGMSASVHTFIEANGRHTEYGLEIDLKKNHFQGIEN